VAPDFSNMKRRPRIAGRTPAARPATPLPLLRPRNLAE